MAVNVTHARQCARRARQRLQEGFLTLQELALREPDTLRQGAMLQIAEHAAKLMGELFTAERDSFHEDKLEAYLLKTMLGLRALLGEIQLLSDDRLLAPAESAAMAVATLYSLSRTQRPVHDGSEPPSRRNAPSTHPLRRATRRVQVEAQVGFATETNFFAGLSMDISAGGLFVATHEVHPVGTNVALQFALPDGRRISAFGEVRWVRETVSGGSMPGLGIAFTQIAPEDLQAIRRFCVQRIPMLFEDAEK